MAVPLMPTGADEVATPMPGGPPGGGYPPPTGGPTGPGPGGDLASLLAGAGGAPPMGAGVDPLQGALGIFDMMAQTVSDAARVFPGSEQRASEIMELIDLWRQEALVMATPPDAAMPGADMMM